MQFSTKKVTHCPGVEGDEWYEYNQTATEPLPIGSHAQGGPFIVR